MRAVCYSFDVSGNNKIDMSNNENILLKNRSAFTARQSIESLIAYARSFSSHLGFKTTRFMFATNALGLPDLLCYSRSSSSLFPMPCTYFHSFSELDHRILEKHLSIKCANNSIRGEAQQNERIFCARDVPERA